MRALIAFVYLLGWSSHLLADDDVKNLAQSVGELKTSIDNKSSPIITYFYATLSSLIVAGFTFLATWLWNRKQKPKILATIDMSAGSKYESEIVNENKVVINKARYFRAIITNTKKIYARNCRGYLTKIEQLKGNTWASMTYYDILQLTWAFALFPTEDKSEYEKDLINGLNYYLDIAYIDKNSIRLCLLKKVMKYWDYLEVPANYKLHIVIVGENIDPYKFTVELGWHGNVETVSMKMA